MALFRHVEGNIDYRTVNVGDIINTDAGVLYVEDKTLQPKVAQDGNKFFRITITCIHATTGVKCRLATDTKAAPTLKGWYVGPIDDDIDDHDFRLILDIKSILNHELNNNMVSGGGFTFIPYI